MAQSASALMTAVGSQQRKPEEALRYLPLAQGLSRGDPKKEGHVRYGLGQILQVQGKLPEAELEFRAALSRWEEDLGPAHALVMTARSALAIVLTRQGKHAESEAEFRTVLSQRIQALGPAHPIVAISRNNLGTTLEVQGKIEEAEEQIRAALALGLEVLDPQHPHIASSHYNLASVRVAVGWRFVVRLEDHDGVEDHGPVRLLLPWAKA